MDPNFQQLAGKYNLPRLTKLSEVLNKDNKLIAGSYRVDETGLYLFFLLGGKERVCCFLKAEGTIKEREPDYREYLNLLCAIETAQGIYPKIDEAIREFTNAKD
jgi:hypothetical protein